MEQYSPSLMPSNHSGLGTLTIDIWGEIVLCCRFWGTALCMVGHSAAPWLMLPASTSTTQEKLSLDVAKNVPRSWREKGNTKSLSMGNHYSKSCYTFQIHCKIHLTSLTCQISQTSPEICANALTSDFLSYSHFISSWMGWSLHRPLWWKPSSKKIGDRRSHKNKK